MALETAPRTPAVAIARELRRLGLTQGAGKDFQVAGHYRNGERDHTYVLLLTRHANEVVAENADLIEERTSSGPFPFRVSVRYFGTARPTASIANAGSRVRETPAEETAPAAEGPAPAAPAPLPASETPGEELPTPHAPAEPVQAAAVDYRERHRQEGQAAALGWSTRHADAVAWAAAGELLRVEDGSARRVAPGRAGRRVAAALLPPLVAAGFLADVERDGATRIEPTGDGRRALQVWDLHRPEPVERPRKREGLPLRPLLGGQEAARRSAAFRADEERRLADRARWYEEFEQRQAAEAWEDRLWGAWARVAGITYRLGRKRPAGWAPTDEEARLHGLDAGVVAALRSQASTAVEDGEYPADREQPRRHPDTLHPPRVAT
ncbi:hypothetical protein [Streptomyces sp. NPDC055912]|uniref:hypothetical protein n=1 Tax=Streptomyces sp. NPDC055912 TaxID=3345660 RepID=UPI0035DC6821